MELNKQKKYMKELELLVAKVAKVLETPSCEENQYTNWKIEHSHRNGKHNVIWRCTDCGLILELFDMTDLNAALDRVLKYTHTQEQCNLIKRVPGNTRWGKARNGDVIELCPIYPYVGDYPGKRSDWRDAWGLDQ